LDWLKGLCNRWRTQGGQWRHGNWNIWLRHVNGGLKRFTKLWTFLATVLNQILADKGLSVFELGNVLERWYPVFEANGWPTLFSSIGFDSTRAVRQEVISGTSTSRAGVVADKGSELISWSLGFARTPLLSSASPNSYFLTGLKIFQGTIGSFPQDTAAHLIADVKLSGGFDPISSVQLTLKGSRAIIEINGEAIGVPEKLSR